MGQRLTPVTTGWVVKKSFTKEKPGGSGTAPPKRYDKVVSRLYSSQAAADTYKRIAEKSYEPTAGEYDVTFYVTTQDGMDNLPAPF